MDDFERGAREMQRVAAEAMDALAKNTEKFIAACSTGLDHGYTLARLREAKAHYLIAAETIRSISIEGAINAVVGDER